MINPYKSYLLAVKCQFLRRKGFDSSFGSGSICVKLNETMYSEINPVNSFGKRERLVEACRSKWRHFCSFFKPLVTNKSWANVGDAAYNSNRNIFFCTSLMYG